MMSIELSTKLKMKKLEFYPVDFIMIIERIGNFSITGNEVE